MSRKAPKCPYCLEGGKVNQTYRMVGGAHGFKCMTCKSMFAPSEFTDIDYHWHDKKDEWLERWKTVSTTTDDIIARREKKVRDGA